MGEDDVLALPGITDLPDVEAPNRQHDGPALVVDLVPVDVQRVREAVDLPLGLASRHLFGGQPGIDHRHVGQHVLELIDISGGETRLVVELDGGDPALVEPICETGGCDVPLDELGFPLRLDRLDSNPLIHQREDPADDEMADKPDSDRHRRQPPAGATNVGHEQPGAEQRDQCQQLEGRELDVDVGGQGTVVGPPGGGDEVEPVEPVGPRPEQGQNRQQHRDVELDARRHPIMGHRGPDAAVEIVGDQDHDQGQDQGGEEPVDDEGPEREPEHIEADVAVEQGIRSAEIATVAEQQPRLPLRRGVGPGDEAEQGGHPEADLAGLGPDHGVVSLDQVLFRRFRPGRGLETIGEVEVAPQDGEEEQGEHRGQEHLGAEGRRPDTAEVELVEPEPVGVETGDAVRRQEQDKKGRNGDEGDYTEPRGFWATKGTHLRRS